MIFDSFLFGIAKGTWYTPGVQVISLKMQDVNGAAITVGATVKLVGTVTSINPNSDHLDNITFQTNNPSGPSTQNPAGQLVLSVHPLNLVVGS